jgi:hypothetical protein
VTGSIGLLNLITYGCWYTSEIKALKKDTRIKALDIQHHDD